VAGEYILKSQEYIPGIDDRPMIELRGKNQEIKGAGLAF
jgi:hypothetical protein